MGRLGRNGSIGSIGGEVEGGSGGSVSGEVVWYGVGVCIGGFQFGGIPRQS